MKVKGLKGVLVVVVLFVLVLDWGKGDSIEEGVRGLITEVGSCGCTCGAFL